MIYVGHNNHILKIRYFDSPNFYVTPLLLFVLHFTVLMSSILFKNVNIKKTPGYFFLSGRVFCYSVRGSSHSFWNPVTILPQRAASYSRCSFKCWRGPEKERGALSQMPAMPTPTSSHTFSYQPQPPQLLMQVLKKTEPFSLHFKPLWNSAALHSWNKCSLFYVNCTATRDLHLG